MTVAGPSVNRAPRPSGLADVLDLVLDKGIVIDAYVRLAVVGIEILTLDARVVIASVDTYLRFAEAVNRLDLQPQGQAAGLPGLVEELRDGGGNGKPADGKAADEKTADEKTDNQKTDGAGERSSDLRRPARRSRQQS